MGARLRPEGPGAGERSGPGGGGLRRRPRPPTRRIDVRRLLSTGRWWLGLLAALLAAIVPARARAEIPVGLELVLAVDVSSSIDAREFALQRDGIVAALRHPAVVAAIEALPGGIALAVVQWSSFDRQALAVPWMEVTTAVEAAAFSARVETMPRRFDWGQTLIGEALRFSADSIRDNGFVGRRRVIDLSGDGGARYGILPRRHRDRVVAEGVTINGLAILTHDAGLADYYRRNVIGGFAAFVMTAATLADFANAMTRKLLREIEGEPLAEGRPMAGAGAG